jgi:hypothetical protein
VKRISSLLLILVLVFTTFLFARPLKATAAFQANILIDDAVFNTNSMNASQIDSWLNGFSQSCISPNSGFEARVPSGYSPSGGFTYGNFSSAGQVIATAAQVYGLNPQVLLVTLQKEQSLVQGGSGYCNNGDENKYSAAIGYGCPDGGTVYNYSGISLYRRNGVEHTTTGSTCVNSSVKAGFSQQVIRGAWLLKFGQQRSLGNTGWAVVTGSWDNSDDPPTCFGGPMTQGTYKRCQSGSAAFYDGYTTIDGSATHMDSGATAALYWYTPHFHGNQNFVSLFESWFGSTISAGYYSCHDATNISNVNTGAKVIANKYNTGEADRLSITLLNNTGSKCIEVHTWQYGNQSWYSNIATNHPAFNMADGEIISGNLVGDGRDELVFVKYHNTGSGNIEVHTWNPGYQTWYSNIATNVPSTDADNGQVLAADINGDGRDELVFVKYHNTGSGNIEVHTWNPGYQTWYSNIATNITSVDTNNGYVIRGNTAGRDHLMFVKTANTGTGRIEVHTWNPGYQTWYSNIATNLSNADSSNGKLISIDDKLAFVKYLNTGTGRIEVHTWNPGYQTWYSNIATNY